MCVRYTLHKTDAALGVISRALGTPLACPGAEPRFNATVTDMMPVVAREQGGACVRSMRWGLVASGGGQGAAPRLLVNARSETARSMPAFRDAVTRRRCLVPANGFYEWQTRGGVKFPHLFTLVDEEPFAFAGIWDPPAGDFPETFCLLTTTPNSLVGAVHDRMPVLLTQETMARWLGDQPLGEPGFRDLVRPLEASRMASRRVSRYVNSSRNQGPACLDPADEPPPEPEFDFG